MYVSFVQLINPTTQVNIYISALKFFMFLGRRHFSSLHWLFISKDIIVVIVVELLILFTEILIGPSALNSFGDNNNCNN